MLLHRHPSSQQLVMLPARPSPTHSRLFNIPEILQAIASHLDSTSLVSCLQVSHHWFRTCAPLLWNQISAQDWLRCSTAGINADGKWSPAILLANIKPAPLSSSSSSSHSSSASFQPNSYAPLVRSLEYHASLVRQRHWIIPPLSLCSHPVVTPTALTRTSKDEISIKSLVCQGHSDNTFVGEQSSGVLERNASHVPTGAPPLDGCFCAKKNQAEPVPPQQQQETPHGQLTLCAAKGMTSILRNCTNIQILRLHAECYGNGEQGIPFETLCMIGSLTYLQSLELFLNNIVFPTTEPRNDGFVGEVTVGPSRVATRELCIQELVRHCSQLRRLVLRGTAFKFLQLEIVTPTESGEIPTVTNSAVAFTLPSLHDLTLDISGLAESELAYWLHQCPNLSSLSLPGGLTWEWSDDFLHMMTRTSPHLETFSINGSSFGSLAISEERLTALVRAFSANGQLKALAVRACQFGDSTLQALQESAPSLEHLDISLTRPGLSTAGLLSYLCQPGARNLKCVEADGVWIQSHDLKEFVLQQEARAQQGQQQLCWTCKDTLERLVIGFSSPDRTTANTIPAPSTTDLPNAAGPEVARPLSWYMYKLLSSLTQLEHLQFSHTCLDLSNEGGIHQLKTLKRLRTFSIESCGYARLTQDQVRWMASTAHWPRLEMIFINPPGTSCERQIQAWLTEMNRQDDLQLLSLQRQKRQQHSNVVWSW